MVERPSSKVTSPGTFWIASANSGQKIGSGATRFATVLTRNVSDYGVYVECQSPVSIPLFRLVQFQLERDARECDALPGSLQNGRVLGAVYRVSPPRGSQPQGLALRLMVDPRRMAAATDVEAARATA